jgi:molybdenum cofactor biosynthesis protein B
MSEIPAEHRATAPRKVTCAIVTVSDTRTPQTDAGGQAVHDLLTAAGYEVAAREIIRDEPAAMRRLLEKYRDDESLDAVLLTGGTGVSSRDQTYETLAALLTRQLPGYGELFRMLSFAEIGAAAMLSRATGGLMGRTVVLSMPGSPAAVRLAVEKLIVPELRHLVREARR